MSEAALSLNAARELFSYCPRTGEIRWASSTNRRIRIGALAGNLRSDGYLEIQANGVRVRAHRLAWFIYYGEWPEHDIDHINGRRADNRIINLRDVPRQVNIQNQSRARRDSSSGLLGAHWNDHDKVWHAKITVDARSVYLGTYKTPEDAHAAYVEAKRTMHAGCTL